MLLRKSQLKFNPPNFEQLVLRVASTAADYQPSLFMESAIKAFEDSGGDPDQIHKIFTAVYADLAVVSKESLNLLRRIFRVSDGDLEVKSGMKARYLLLNLAIRLEEARIPPERYQTSFLALYLSKIAKRTRDKHPFSIPIPGSCCVLGLTDNYQILNAGEVFVHTTVGKVKGPVLIYRDPILHLGDIQRATAVDYDELADRIEALGLPDGGERMRALHNMYNVIFFSQKDDPPLPHRLAGGDLDGDRFEFLTQDCGFWDDGYQITPPADYTDGNLHPMGNDNRAPQGQSMPHAPSQIPIPTKVLNPVAFDIGDLAEFIGNYIRNDCFEDLQNLLMNIADLEMNGMHHPHAQELAPWLSKAVDYPKNGREVNLVRNIYADQRFRASERPDFIPPLKSHPDYNHQTTCYKSWNPLGNIYRMIQKIEYKAPECIDDEPLYHCIYGENYCLADRLKTSEFAQDIVVLEGDIEKFALKEYGRYRHYVASQYLPEESEVDLFLRKQQDDFPNMFIKPLIRGIVAVLKCHGIIEKCRTDYALRPFAAEEWRGRNVVDIYKFCLFVAQ
jgi:RNA dependent RNA polymerase